MNQNANDNMALRRMLREIADLAENASLTGGLSTGASRAVNRYNAVLRQLVESGSVPKGIFEELSPETTDFGQLGVDARLLASYLKGQGESGNGTSDASMLIRLAPFVRGEDLAALVKEHIAKGVHVSGHVITALAPFLGSDMLGDLVREHLITPGDQPAAPAPPAPPSSPSPAHGQTMEDLLTELRKPELSREDRERIAQRIAELSSR
jgi:hypothetical protein